MGKYISHLDLLRAFTRSITRAELPVKYTQGFNPHQIITFSLPLPIGVTSETEFVDIDFEESVTDLEIMNRLNENLPPDIRILSVGELVYSATNIVSASYEILLKSIATIDMEKVNNFFDKKDIPVIKKTKKGDKEVNLVDYIKSIKINKILDNELKLNAVLSAGGAMNIKPEILVFALEKSISIGEFEEVYIHRTKIFVDINNEITEMK